MGPPQGPVGRDVAGLHRLRHLVDDLVLRAGSDPSAVLKDAIGELDIAIEELTVALEELHEQNAELIAVRGELESEQRYYRELFDLAPDAFMLTDPLGMIHGVNRAATRLLAAPRARIVGYPIASFVPRGERPAFRTGMQRVLSEGGRQDWTFGLAPPTRTTVLVSTSIAVGYDSNGVVTDLRWVLRDVTEARRAQQRMQEGFAARTEEAAGLRETHRWKDAFMAAAAHDLRGPLSVIEVAAETLLERPDIPERHRDSMLRSVHTASRRLQRLIEDLLDLDRFSRGAVVAERRPVAMRDLLDRVLGDLAITTHPTTLTATEAVAQVDGPRVGQIVANLVGNAIQHTPAGTPIDVSMAESDGGIRLVVEDRGPGIPADVLNEVFQPFVTSSAHPDDQRRTGLGLSLVLLFARLHGGTARAEERAGGGARFVVDLPTATTTAP